MCGGGTLDVVACDPDVQTPPRCRLRRLYVRPGATVEGYGDDGRIEVRPDAHFAIGRAAGCDVHVASVIGGHRTFVIHWRAPRWIFKVNNEWAIVRLDGELLDRATFESRPVHDGSVVEIYEVTSGELVHRLRVELG